MFEKKDKWNSQFPTVLEQLSVLHKVEMSEEKGAERTQGQSSACDPITAQGNRRAGCYDVAALPAAT